MDNVDDHVQRGQGGHKQGGLGNKFYNFYCGQHCVISPGLKVGLYACNFGQGLRRFECVVYAGLKINIGLSKLRVAPGGKLQFPRWLENAELAREPGVSLAICRVRLLPSVIYQLENFIFGH